MVQGRRGKIEESTYYVYTLGWLFLFSYLIFVLTVLL